MWSLTRHKSLQAGSNARLCSRSLVSGRNVVEQRRTALPRQLWPAKRQTHDRAQQSPKLNSLPFWCVSAASAAGVLITLLYAQWIEPQNPSLCKEGATIVKSAGSKGYGTFATQDIAPGTTIMVDEVAIDDSMKHMLHKNLFTTWSQHAAEDQNKGTLSEADQSENARSFRDSIDNVPVHTRNTGAYLKTARLNHSCVPNAEIDVQELLENPRSARVVAVRPIKEGEEVCVSYGNYFGYLDVLTKAERQEAIHRMWGFTCICCGCTLHAEKQKLSDARRMQIRENRSMAGKLAELLDEVSVSERARPADALSQVLLEQVKIMRDENLIGARLAANLLQVATVKCAVINAKVPLVELEDIKNLVTYIRDSHELFLQTRGAKDIEKQNSATWGIRMLSSPNIAWGYIFLAFSQPLAAKLPPTIPVPAPLPQSVVPWLSKTYAVYLADIDLPYLPHDKGVVPVPLTEAQYKEAKETGKLPNSAREFIEGPSRDLIPAV